MKMADGLRVSKGVTGDYSYTLSDLDDYGDMVYHTSQVIADIRRDISNEVSKIQSAWKGESADEYIKNITKYDGDLKHLNDALDSVARSLKQVARITQENADARKAAIDSELN